MHRKLVRRLALLALPIGLLAFYYWAYEEFSLRLIYRQHVYYEKANGLKHALAAAQLTELFSHFLNDDDAEQLVLWLGNQNEYMEQVICRPRDSTAEVLKDMTNNQVGITIALWLRHHPRPESTAEFMLKVTKHHVLVEAEREVALHPSDAARQYWDAVDTAKRHLAEDRQAIITRTLAAIEATVRKDLP